MPWKDQWIYQHNGPACLRIYLLSIKSKIFNHMYVCFLHRRCRKLYKEMTSFSGWPTVLKAKHRLNPINPPPAIIAWNMTPGVPSYENRFSPPLANRSPWNLSLLLSLITDWRRFTQQQHFPPVSSLSSFLINPFTGNKNLPVQLTTFPVHYLLINLNCSTPDR